MLEELPWGFGRRASLREMSRMVSQAGFSLAEIERDLGLSEEDALEHFIALMQKGYLDDDLRPTGKALAWTEAFR